jgi:hypothetical protein
VAGAVGGAVGVFAVREARGVVFLGLLGDGSRSVRLVRTLAIVVVVVVMLGLRAVLVVIVVVVIVVVVAVGLAVVVGGRDGEGIGAVVDLEG